MTVVWFEQNEWWWHMEFVHPDSGKLMTFGYMTEAECIKAANNILDLFMPL